MLEEPRGPKGPPAAFDEWGRFQGTEEQQGCILKLMIPGVALMVVGCFLVYAFGGNPTSLDSAINSAASSHIASSASYGSGANALSSILCFGIAGMFGFIILWSMSRKG